METVVSWIGEWFANGITWLVEGGVELLIKGTGGFCRFMTTEVSSSFLLFGMIGMFFVIAGAREKGVKMVNMSVLVYLIMLVVGATC